MGVQPPSFTCPVCDMTTYHPEDIDQGYCGFCHEWTGDAGYMMVKAELNKTTLGQRAVKLSNARRVADQLEARLLRVNLERLHRRLNS